MKNGTKYDKVTYHTLLTTTAHFKSLITKNNVNCHCLSLSHAQAQINTSNQDDLILTISILYLLYLLVCDIVKRN